MLVGDNVVVSVSNNGVLKGNIATVSEQGFVMDVTEVLEKCYPNTTIKLGMTTFAHGEVVQIEKSNELPKFLVTWYDTGLEHEDSEIIQANSSGEAEQMVSEGNRYAEDICAIELRDVSARV